MTDKPLAVAADHAGFELKSVLIEDLKSQGYDILDLGTHGPDSVDYPDFGHALAEAIVAGKADRGIIVCGTGIGIAIAANRHPGVRAAVCHDQTSARLGREHNNANVLALGARLVGTEVAKDCAKTFLTTAFAGGRHARRVEKLG